MLKPTFLTLKPGLSASVFTVNVTTPRALLACVPRVNVFNSKTYGSSLVVKKPLKSSKRPGVHTPPLVFPSFHTCPDVGKVFKNYSRTLFSGINNSSGDNVVTIFAEAVFLLRELFQVSLSRVSAFRLECAFQVKVAFSNMFPMFFTKKLIITRDCGSVNSQVNSSHGFRRGDVRFLRGYNYMKEHAVPFKTQIRGTDFPSNVFSVIVTDRKSNGNPSSNGRKCSSSLVKSDTCGTSVIPNRVLFPCGTGSLFPFPQLILSGRKSFRSLHPSRNNELTRERSNLSFPLVSEVMEFHSVDPLNFPTIFANPCKRLRELFSCFPKFLRFKSLNWNFKSYCLQFNLSCINIS